MAATQSFLQGDTMVPSVRWSNEGALIDPDTVSLKVRVPAGTETTYTYSGATVTRDGLGEYHKDVTAATAGQWVFRWVSTGPAIAIETVVQVAPSLLASP